MHQFCKLLGVKTQDFSAPDEPTHHAVVERRNQVMGKMLDVGISKGDITDRNSLDMYCATAASACNLEHTFNGHTVLEYLTGEIPRTQRELVAVAEIPTLLSELDHDFLVQLRDLLNETNKLVQIARDDAARYSATLRDVEANRHYTTQFTLLPGDYVSYDGNTYKLLDINDASATEPVKATIRATDHDGSTTKTVRYSTLRPLATPRPELTFSTPAHTNVSPGDFVFFKADNSQDVLAGMVVSRHDGSIVVHEYRRAPRIATMYKQYTAIHSITGMR